MKRNESKKTENSCHDAGNMPYFETNHAGSIVAHSKYDSIIENVHLSILQY